MPFRFLLLLALVPGLSAVAGRSVVSISGEEFLINGMPTYAGQFWQGHKIQGLLLNARLVQATFDDRNAETVTNWAYADTRRWDPDRNTAEFLAAMPGWKSHGLVSFTLNMQGGSPQGYSKAQPWHNSAFNSDGSLDPACLGRLERVLERADELGMVPILGLFYFGQDERLADEASVLAAVDNTVAWLAAKGWRNVILEINNECNVAYDHEVLQPGRVHELIERVKRAKSGGHRFLVSTSYGGGTLPGTNVLKAADFVLLHGNGVSDPRRIATMVHQTRELPGYKPKPIVFNEDDHFEFDRPLNNFTAAIGARAGWGYFDYRLKGEGPSDGFQSVPVDWRISSPRKRAFFALLAEVTGSLPQGALWSAAPAARWWKGNLHTHTLWSDGDDYPEMVAAWYKAHGYHFLALSDHNLMQRGQKWFNITTNRGGGAVLEKYRQAYGADWVEEREQAGGSQVRLKPLSEFGPLLDEPGRFLLLPAEEITGGHLAFPVHVNATNLRDAIEPKGGSNVLEVMQGSVNAVLRQRGRTGQPMFPHINHPNFGWGITAEELMHVAGERFFEVYNGHPAVHNEGDATHASLERMWDIVLTWRLGVLGMPPMFGIATDDSHTYHTNAVGLSNPGRGWLQVRAPRLTAESLVGALERGDFYATSGIQLSELRREGRRVILRIRSEPGIDYHTKFIGTRRGFNPDHESVRTDAGEKLRVTERYSPEVGEIFSAIDGPEAVYELKGDELYVRATITSSKPMVNPYRAGETESAWVQPVIP